MEGINYIVDDEGRPKAVVIDLEVHGEFWEDVYDSWLIRQRKDEPRESFEEVKRHLREIGKLAPIA